MNLCLIRHGYPFTIIKSDDRQKYNEVLAKADSIYFLNFITRSVLDMRGSYLTRIKECLVPSPIATDLSMAKLSAAKLSSAILSEANLYLDNCQRLTCQMLICQRLTCLWLTCQRLIYQQLIWQGLTCQGLICLGLICQGLTFLPPFLSALNRKIMNR